jgi:hypothetical protein
MMGWSRYSLILILILSFILWDRLWKRCDDLKLICMYICKIFILNCSQSVSHLRVDENGALLVSNEETRNETCVKSDNSLLVEMVEMIQNGRIPRGSKVYPDWMIRPELEKSEWINRIISSLWPQIRQGQISLLLSNNNHFFQFSFNQFLQKKKKKKKKKNLY